MKTERSLYEAPEVTLVFLGKTDVITTSGPFNGRGDDIVTWTK